MNVPRRPLSEVSHDAYQALIDKLGLADALRFVGQFTSGSGDYTAEREAKFGQVSLEEIVSTIEKRRVERRADR